MGFLLRKCWISKQHPECESCWRKRPLVSPLTSLIIGNPRDGAVGEYDTAQHFLSLGPGCHFFPVKHFLNPPSIPKNRTTLPPLCPGKTFTHRYQSVSDFISILIQLLVHLSTLTPPLSYHSASRIQELYPCIHMCVLGTQHLAWQGVLCKMAPESNSWSTSYSLNTWVSSDS